MKNLNFMFFHGLGLLLLTTIFAATSEGSDLFGSAPEPKGPVLLLETFEHESKTNWIHSSNSKYSGVLQVSADDFGGHGLEVPFKARHYGSSIPLLEPLEPWKGFVFQYELTLKAGMECGGAYVKLLTHSPTLNLALLDGDSPYTVMFGPDKCGTTNKVHLIFRHQSPLTGEWEEKHLDKPPLMKLDNLPHLYSLVVYPDNTYQVLIDNEVSKEGSLFEDFTPPFNPPASIPDPSETKPVDWVDKVQISDPAAVKPDDWDEEAPAQIEDEVAEMPMGWLEEEPLMVEDPEAEQPGDWDVEEDGEWEAPKIKNPACVSAPGCGKWKRPMIPNPAFKGKWSPPNIPNPDYKGPWAAKQIPNPNFFEDKEPLKSIGKIGAVAVEIWTMSHLYSFDNFLASYDEDVADDYAERTWKLKFEAGSAKAEEAKQVKENASEENFDAAKTLRSVVGAVLPGLLAPLEDLMEKVDPLAVLVALVVGPLLLIFLLAKLVFPAKKTKKTANSETPTEDKEEKEEDKEEEPEDKKDQ